MSKHEEAARDWLIEWNNKQALHPSQDKCVTALAALLDRAENEAQHLEVVNDK
jgi:hypothetical protein